MEKCTKCDGGISTRGSNYRVVEGEYYHKKCPQAPMPEEEKVFWNDLRLAIEHQNGRKMTGIQWGLATKQIKSLKDDGYSYEDQLYAFKWYFDPSKKNVFKGYGIIGHVIAEAMEEKKKLVEQALVFNGDSKTKMLETMEKKRRERMGLYD